MFSLYLRINMCAWLCGNVHICFKTCSSNCRRQLPSATMYPVSPHLEMACLLPGQQLRCSVGLSLSSLAWLPQSPTSICPDPSSLASSSQPFCSSDKVTQHPVEANQSKGTSFQSSHFAIHYVYLGPFALPPWSKERERAPRLHPLAPMIILST